MEALGPRGVYKAFSLPLMATRSTLFHGVPDQPRYVLRRAITSSSGLSSSVERP